MPLHQDPGFLGLAQRFNLRRTPAGAVTPSAANGWLGRTSEETGGLSGFYWDGTAWARNPNGPNRVPVVPEGTPRIGRTFLDSNEGAGAAYSLFKGLADPGKQHGLSNAFQDNYNQYKAAVAIKPTLTYTDWLSEVDPNALYKSLDFFTRGERPSNYQGKYKFIGGG